MSSKWNEKLVTNFLKAYKQHPCLWNPYHKGYYNCREKNEALRMIIDSLGTTGLTVTDYLQQIKIIREKYKQEQARVIKCMQSQKQYRSPFPWYYIVAEMLRKVINDEEKTNSRTTLSSENHDTLSVLKSLSSDDIRESLRREKAGSEAKGIRTCTCAGSTIDEIVRRSKSAEKPIRGKHRGSIASKSDENRSKVRIRFVPCPHLKKKQSISKDKDEDTLLSHKPTRDTESLVNEHSSSSKESEKSSESPFLKCPTCGWETLNYNHIEQNAEKLNDQEKCSCSGYIRDTARNYILCPGYDQVTRDENVDPNSKKYMNNSGDFEIFRNLTKQAPSPSVSSRAVETVPSKSNIETSAEPKKISSIGVQYKEKSEKPVNVPIQTHIIEVDSATANKLQGNIVEACLKIILSGSRGNLKENKTSSVSQNAQEVQYTGPELKTKGTEVSKNASDTRTNEVGTNTLNYTDVGIQNTVCTSDGATRCASCQTDKEKCRRTTTKGVAANIIDKETKGIQSTVCVSRASLIYRRSSDGREIGTTTSACQVRHVTCSTQGICDGRNVPAIRARSQGSVNRCVRHVDFKSIETQEIDEPCRSDTCPRNIMSLIKNDPTVALMVQKLLLTILYPKSEQSTQSERSSSSGLQTDNDTTCRLKGNCTIDVTEMLDKIKEHTTRTLGTDASDFRITEAKEIRQKFDAATSSQELQAKPVFHSSTMTMTDKDDFKSLYRNASTEPAKPENPESDTELMKRKYSVDKETSTTSVSKDVDKSEQTEPNSVSVGTQKRDPILVRVIKCNGSQAIIRSDKQTLTASLQDKSTDKFVETCGRSTCIPYKIIRRPTESSVECVLRKKRDNAISNAYRRRSILHNNYTCSENCKDRAHSDWTDLSVCYNKQYNLHPCDMHK